MQTSWGGGVVGRIGRAARRGCRVWVKNWRRRRWRAATLLGASRRTNPSIRDRRGLGARLPRQGLARGCREACSPIVPHPSRRSPVSQLVPVVPRGSLPVLFCRCRLASPCSSLLGAPLHLRVGTIPRIDPLQHRPSDERRWCECRRGSALRSTSPDSMCSAVRLRPSRHFGSALTVVVPHPNSLHTPIAPQFSWHPIRAKSVRSVSLRRELVALDPGVGREVARGPMRAQSVGVVSRGGGHFSL